MGVTLRFEVVDASVVDASVWNDLRSLWWMCSPPWRQARDLEEIVAEGLFGWLR